MLSSGEFEAGDRELSQTLGDCEDAVWRPLKDCLEGTASVMVADFQQRQESWRKSLGQSVFQLAEMRHICVK